MISSVYNATIGDLEGMSREEIEKVVSRIEERQRCLSVPALGLSEFWDNIRSSHGE